MVALLVVFWEWLSVGDSGGATVRNVALALVGTIALPLAIWRSSVADRQSRTAQQSLLNERYQKGAEMLGSEVLSVRLAGIYALQGLATEHPEQYHIQVMRLFSSFVRFPTKDQSLESEQGPIRPGTLMGIRQDVESALEAIGTRQGRRKCLEERADFRLDLRGTNLSEAQILNADLSKAMFHHANLSSVSFANTDLTDAFFPYADMSKAQFHDVNFTRTRLSGANLSGAKLQGTAMVRMNLRDVTLSGANLVGANLSESILQNAKLVDAWLDRANLSCASFLGADLSGAQLVGADLSRSDFLDTNLTSANISEANISGAQFSNEGWQPAIGLTQAQLDQARADASNPPRLLAVLDAETGEQLVWHEQTPGEGA